MANLKSKLINGYFKFLDFMAYVYYSIKPIYSGNLAKLPSPKLFLNVSSLILFLNHSIWSFVPQVIAFLL